MKKCPQGVICIENFTMVIIIIALIILLYVSYVFLIKQKEATPIRETTPSMIKQPNIERDYSNPYFLNNSFIQQPVPGDVLLNPYIPPARVMPINISTNVGAVDTSYIQVGILNPIHKSNKDNILPLMGRPVFTNRNLWQYYTVSNQYNNVKLPITIKGKSASNEYGVDRLYVGDTVRVEGLNDVYRATIYDTDTIKYLPFI
jgi:hypothetical protein